MNYLTLLDELFTKAEKYGIKKSDIGREIYGDKNRTDIYLHKNPSLKMLQKISDTIDFIKKNRKKIQ